MYQHIKAFKARYGRQLMERFGVHALGIGRKLDDAGRKTNKPALIFYVAPGAGEERNIPASFDYIPEGQEKAIQISTQVIESPEASFE